MIGSLPHQAQGVRLTHVLETHQPLRLRLRGGLELAHRSRAAYLVPAGDVVAFNRTPVSEGDVVAASSMRLRVLHTPGTPPPPQLRPGERRNYHRRVHRRIDAFGSPGRTDLGPEHTQSLTHTQFHSVPPRPRAPPDARVYPQHGFGGFCSATSGDSSTVGQQQNSPTPR